MTGPIQNVNVCGVVKVSDATAHGLLAQILAALGDGITVNPSDAWGAIFLEALNAAEITLSAETIAALNPMTVIVDTSAGPVEITGTVTLANDNLSVTITNTPLDIVVTNWDELLNATLNVSLNGETVNVSLSDEQIKLLTDKDDTDDDVRPVAVHCFDWTSGEDGGQFIGWANANEDGSFAGYTIISGTPPPEGALVVCETMSVTTITPVTLEPICANVGGVPTVVTPIPLVDTGVSNIVGTVYADATGKPVEGKISFDTNPCDCLTPCPDCDVELPLCDKNSLFFTTATINNTLTGVCDGNGNDISSQFNVTFPLDLTTAPNLEAWRVALETWLNANGATSVTFQQGRDGWSFTWVGPELSIKREGVETTQDSCQEVVTNLCENIKVRMFAFDNDRGLLEAGETTTYDITDGTLTNTVVHDYTTSADGVTVSSWYTPVIAAINALPNWSIALVTDVPADESGKVLWEVTYNGPGNEQLEIVKVPNGDVYRVRIDDQCNITTSALDSSGTEIPSPVFQAVK